MAVSAAPAPTVGGETTMVGAAEKKTSSAGRDARVQPFLMMIDENAMARPDTKRDDTDICFERRLGMPMFRRSCGCISCFAAVNRFGRAPLLELCDRSRTLVNQGLVSRIHATARMPWIA